MTVGIVECLKVVNIQYQYRQRLIGAAGALVLFAQSSLEEAVVLQPGEGIRQADSLKGFIRLGQSGVASGLCSPRAS